MRFSSAIATAILAFSASVLAAPAAGDGKPFKFAVKSASGETLYLTASGKGSSSKANGVDCTITAGKIACGANKGGIGTVMHAKMAPSPMASNNNGWSIDSSNRITYAPGGTHFNFAIKNRDELWTEKCDTHPDAMTFTKIKAEAVWV